MPENFSDLKKVLIERDGITPEEADIQIKEAKEVLQEYLEEGDQESAHDICQEFFGLEPDYLMDLI